MKKLILSVVLAAAAFTSNAQLKQGHIQYKIDVSSDDPNMQMQIQMLQGSTMDTYFDGKKSRTDFTVGTLMTTTTISDAENDAYLMLMSGMIGKKAMKSTLTEFEEKGADEQPDYEVTLVDETKDVAGYTCKKAILTDADGNEMVFWYTEEIAINKKGQKNMYTDIPGFPLEYEMNQNGLHMSFTAQDVENKLADEDELFSMEIPEGYTEMTMDEINSMGQGR